MQDLKAGVIRIIGDPVKRYKEDPIRILRVVRLAAKLGFKIDALTEKPILELSGLLQNVPPARLYVEIMKLFCEGRAAASFELLRHYGLYGLFFPQSEACLQGAQQTFTYALLTHAFYSIDQRFLERKSVNSAFLFAILLWNPLQKAVKNQHEELSLLGALDHGMDAVLKKQLMYIAIPRRLIDLVREIWILQYRFSRRQPDEARRLLGHPQFRAAYDFLLLRAKAGEDVCDLAIWWTKFEDATEPSRIEMLQKMKEPIARHPRRRWRHKQKNTLRDN